MRRLAPILLLLAFAGSGSGGAAALHRLEHTGAHEAHEAHVGHVEGAHADAHEASRAAAAADPHHPAGECRLCADLRAPATADRWDPCLVPVGTARSHVPPLVPQRDHVDVDVRIETTGPPAS